MSLTLGQCHTFLQDYDRLNGSSRALRVYTKAVNDALREVYSLGKFDFSTRVTRLSFAAPYSTGTVSIAASGTALTGSGTTFTSAMAGRFIRFNNEAEQYRITAFGSTTGLTVEAYLGTAALSGATYTITDERKPMPSLFRSVQSLVTNNATGSRNMVDNLQFVPYNQLNMLRLVQHTSVDLPTFYSTNWEAPASGNIPVGYIHVYPAPATAQIVTVYYTTWPTSVSSTSDELPITYEAEGVVREFMLAYLWREEGRQDWTTQLERARQEAYTALGTTRSVDTPRCRVEWNPSPTGSVHVPQIAQSVLDQMDP